MITAEFKEHKNTGNITIRIEGHAKAAPKGEDLICASASAYVLQAGQLAANMYRDGWLEKKPNRTVKDGKFYLSIRPKEEYRTIVFNMIQVIAIGFSVLESGVPEYVKLTTFGNAETA